MGRKVKVTTKCGETFFYDHDQEVDTVEIVEKKTYELQDTLNHIKELYYNNVCPKVGCDKCAFNIDEYTCAFVRIIVAISRAAGYNPLPVVFTIKRCE